MAEIVNLRTARKQAARKAARAKGDENAAKHGQTRAARDLAQARADKAARDLDAHRRDDGTADGGAAPDGGRD